MKCPENKKTSVVWIRLPESLRDIPEPPTGLLAGSPPPTTWRGKLKVWWVDLHNNLYQIYYKFKGPKK